MKRQLAQLLVLAAGLASLGAPAMAADLAAGKSLYATCAACHGAKAEGNPAVSAPNLSGQDAAYLLKQLQAFGAGARGAAADDRFGAQMRSASAAVLKSDADRANVAAYIASLPAQRSPAKAGSSEVDLQLGQNYFNGICSACHSSSGKGNVSLGAPRLLGQDPAYLVRQYAAFKSGQRGGDPKDKPAKQMRGMTAALPDAKTEAAVLAYVARLPM